MGAGCRSLLYLLANTIFRLYRVLYPRFVVGILTVPFIGVGDRRAGDTCPPPHKKIGKNIFRAKIM